VSPREDITTLTERPHWIVVEGRATYSPVEGGWRAVVSVLRQPVRADRYHIASVDRTGAARWFREAITLAEAVRVAERDVAARNALRPV
jgi:hypothetical protein